jgi:hypothetical protein
MKKYQQWLISLMVLQIFLAVGIWAYNTFNHPKAEQHSLLVVRKSDINRLVIKDATEQLELKKPGNEWLLPAANQLPADAQKIDELLTKLDLVKLAWPVTNTTSSHERFAVAETKYQRHVEYYQGDKKLGDFYLGSSPGFKTIHLRKGGDTKVYAVELNQFDFSANKNDWLSKTLLSTNNIVAIKNAHYDLRKSNNQWLFSNSDLKPDTQKVDAMVTALQNLQALELVADTPKGETANVSINSDQGELQYAFVKVDNNAYVRRSDKDMWFKINLNDYTQIVIPKMDELVRKAEEKPTENKPASK